MSLGGSGQPKRGRWDSSSSDDESTLQDRSIASKSGKGKLVVDYRDREVGAAGSALGSKVYVISSKKGSSSSESLSDIRSDSSNSNNSNSNSNNDNSSVVDISSFVQDIPAEAHIRPEAEMEKESRPPLFYGCRSVDEYQRLSFIDQGTYGAVFRAKDKSTNKVMALKQVKLDANAAHMGFPIAALREINILMALNHPNIIRVTEMVVGTSIDKVYMVMDYYDNDLKYCMSQKKQPFSLGDVKQLMLQLLSAVEHMHSKWFIHRDLKTSNILYSNSGKLCVCDFGLARKYSSPIAAYTHEVVSLYYRAPEILLGSEIYSTPIDMWGVACIFAELITGQVLFQGEGEVDQLCKIYRRLGVPTDDTWPGFSSLPGASKSVQYKIGKRERLRDVFPLTSFSGNAYLNESGFDMLSKLLVYDPKQRLTAADALSHRWIRSEMPSPTVIEFMPKFSSRHDVASDLEAI